MSSERDHEDRPAPPAHRSRLWAALGVGLALLVPPPTTRAATWATAPLPEYKLKAAFLIQFLNFVRWPDSAPSVPAKTVRIGILGDDPFGEVFRTAEGSEVAGRPLEIARFRTLKDLQPCHILFVAASERTHVPDIVKALAGTSTLTVGETADFIRRGGMVQFYPMGDRIRFSIDRAALERASLRPSSKLLEATRPSEDAPAGETRP